MSRYSYDLHIHSCLSPCGDEDMTPNNIVNMARLLGLQVIAVTDHNSIGNAAAVMRVAGSDGPLVLPGMELETAEEVHVVCLFPDLDSAEGFERELAPHFIGIPNRPEVFGEQVLMDERDQVTGRVDRLLATATSLPIDRLPELAVAFGGAAFPAHVDRPSFSVLSNLGFLSPDMGFRSIELSRNAPEDYIGRNPSLSPYRVLRNSDAHYLQHIFDPVNFMELPELSPRAVIGHIMEEEKGGK